MSNAPTENTTEDQQAADTRAVQQALARNAPTKHRRTVGLWVVDTLIYPIVSNTAVFAASLALTYMTWHGEKVGKAGSSLRKFSTAVQGRTKPVIGAFQKLGMGEEAAKGFSTVFFSFVDGTAFAPLVKLLEDRREQFAERIDNTLGTTPADKSVYEAEPKQSWRSVIEGRLATSLIVVPTSIVMQKVGGNEKFLGGLGRFLNRKVEESPGAKSFFTKALGKNTVLPDFFHIAAFEAFYTSVCTGGLYLISRSVARKHPPKQRRGEPGETFAPPYDAQISPREDTRTPQDAIATEGKPETSAHSFTHLERLAQPASAMELTT